MAEDKKTNLIKDKSYEFALKVIGFCIKLKKQHHFEIAAQLLDAGTSVGANVEEALAGQSRKDFISKMSIALKEARESNYWLRLVRDSKLINETELTILLSDSEELKRILSSIVKTSKEGSGN